MSLTQAAGLFFCGLTDLALSCEPQRLRGPIEAPKFQCQTVREVDWSTLWLVSCSALLGGRLLGKYVLGQVYPAPRGGKLLAEAHRQLIGVRKAGRIRRR
jgi:hypothetical protein